MSTVTPQRADATTTEFRNAIVSGLNYVRRQPGNENDPRLLDPALAQRIYVDGMKELFNADFTATPLPAQRIVIDWLVDRINREIVDAPVSDIEFMV